MQNEQNEEKKKENSEDAQIKNDNNFYSKLVFNQYMEEDDDSRCFMSEPSMSTEGEGTFSNTAIFSMLPLSPQELSEEEKEILNRRENVTSTPPPIDQNKLDNPPHQTVLLSPGNTSLSSNDNSPHLQAKVELDFVTSEKQSQLKIKSKPDGIISTARPTFNKAESFLQKDVETAEDKGQLLFMDPSPRSSSSASTAQQIRVAEFLKDLKFQSIGALQDAASEDFDSDRKPAEADLDKVNEVMRRQELLHHRSGIENIDTEPDETIVMTLSESDGDRDTDNDLEPLDWEQQHSADDEQTLDRPRRTRGSKFTSGKKSFSKGRIGHRRTRSGDDVAAAIMTGSVEWRGMKEIELPVPRVLNEEIQRSESLLESLSKNKEFERSFVKSDQSSGESSARYAIGPSERDIISQKANRPPRQSRLSSANDLQLPQQSSRSPNILSPMLKCDDQRTPSRPNLGDVEHFMQQANTAILGCTSDNSYDSFHRTNQYQLSWTQADSIESPIGLNGSNSVSEMYESQELPSSNFLQREHWRERGFFRNGISRSNEFTEGLNSYSEDSEDDVDGNPHLNKSLKKLQFDFRRADNMRSCDTNVKGRLKSPLHGARPMDRIYNQVDIATEQKRKTFFQPIANAASLTKNHPTFTCPQCGLVQRSFFTVSTAPSQIGIGSYLASGFFLYVAISLVIFGMEEGWEGLDCVYFAAITLTTAGLGDFVPTSDSGKIICCIFIYFGVACIGLLLGTYITRMQDENSLKEALDSRVDNCVICSGVKARRRRQHRSKSRELAQTSTKTPINTNIFAASDGTGSSTSHQKTSPKWEGRSMSKERSKSITNTIYSANRRRKRKKRRHYDNKHRRLNNTSSLESFTPESPMSSCSLSHSEEVVSNSQNNSSHQKNSVGLNVIDAYAATRNLPTSPQSPVANVFPSPITGTTFGSPMTTQILGRQRHTRHMSFDVRGSNLFNNQDSKKMYTAKGSDNSSIYTPLAKQEVPVFSSAKDVSANQDWSLFFEGYMVDGQSIFSDSEISEMGEHSRLKTIKYVVLRLRQALMNSIAIITVGSVGFYFIEKISIVDSFYFTTVLLTTVGYGDIVPVTNLGKLFATVYLLIAGTVLLNNMSLISMIPLELRKRRVEKAVLTQFGDQLDDAALRELAIGPLVQRLQLSVNREDGFYECTREMFALAMLVRLGKVKERDILQTFAAFRRLDVDNEGLLNSKTIITGMAHKRKSMKDLRQALYEQPPPPPPPPPKKYGIKNWFGNSQWKEATVKSIDFHTESDEGEYSTTENASLLNENNKTTEYSPYLGGTFPNFVDDEEAGLTF